MINFDDNLKSPQEMKQEIDAASKDSVNDSKETSNNGDIAKNIVDDFIIKIMDASLRDANPNPIYEFLLDSSLNIKQIANIIDDIIYTSFKCNLYALPNISIKIPDANNAKIKIDATTSITTIKSEDMKLESELFDFIKKNIDSISEGFLCKFDGFVHASQILPADYVFTRMEFIQKKLKEKGYNVVWNEGDNILYINAINKSDN